MNRPQSSAQRYEDLTRGGVARAACNIAKPAMLRPSRSYGTFPRPARGALHSRAGCTVNVVISRPSVAGSLPYATARPRREVGADLGSYQPGRGKSTVIAWPVGVRIIIGRSQKSVRRAANWLPRSRVRGPVATVKFLFASASSARSRSSGNRWLYLHSENAVMQQTEDCQRRGPIAQHSPAARPKGLLPLATSNSAPTSSGRVQIHRAEQGFTARLQRHGIGSVGSPPARRIARTASEV